MKYLTTYDRVFSGDTETPITLFYKYVGDEKGFILESRGEGKINYSFLGKNPVACLYGSDKLTIDEGGEKKIYEGKLLDGVRDYLSNFKVETDLDVSFIGGAVGTIGYDVIRQYEKLPDENPDEIGVPVVNLMVFTEFIIYDHMHDCIRLVVLDTKDNHGKARAEAILDKMEKEVKSVVPAEKYEMPKALCGSVTCNVTKEEYMDMVKKAKKYIYDGDIFQVVLSQRLTVETASKPIDLYRQLRQINPSPYLIYYNFGDYQIAGCSPEMLVEVTGNRVKTCPIAGTRKRGKNAEEDIRLALSLKNDLKEQAEHVMLVDLARNDMGRVAEIGSVEVTEFMQVHYYSHVMHMVTYVEGEKKKDEDTFSVLSTFLPAGTLSGAPKIRAMEIIDELENLRRGTYGGACGYFSFNGDMDACITIRTMIIKDGKAYMQAGAGIVADSVPAAEFEECHNKVRALVKAIGGDI
ncbi:MAG: anthranilate synthase component I [Clostridiales bacterium]|nr:anthranilate synthase component I [Clostridiales bacterium]